MHRTMLKILAPALLIALTLTTLAADWQPVGDRLKTRWTATVTPENAWQEYPRPQMVRPQWQNLNGLWDFTVTAHGNEVKHGKILVPYCIESSLSGVGHLLMRHEELWYERTFNVKKTGRLLLHFEAVDYHCEAWVNGTRVGQHTGGNTPFTFDITEAAVDGANALKLKVIDTTHGYQLRGKQVLRPGGIFYTRVSGIWQTVWLETVPATYIQRIKLDTTINPGTITVRTTAGGDTSKATGVEVTASYKGRRVARAKGSLEKTVLTIKDAKLWSPDAPHLYDLNVTLLAGRHDVDTVDSYVGIREVGKMQDHEGRWRFTLNGKEIFHLGPLDQGWWPDGLLTPPSPQAMQYDIDYIKAAGFNFIRNHIKTRPRSYYTYCDRIGLMIWQDQVNARKSPAWTRMKPDPQDAEWPDEAHAQFMAELKEMMDALHNHPSIVVWVPFNEAWGQHRTMTVGEWTVAYDPSRLVNIASGGNFWPVGDIADHHSYPHPAFPIDDPRFNDYICVVGEFGGHGFVVDRKHLWNAKAKNWGYGGLPKTRDEYIGRYRTSMQILSGLKARGVAGGVYTQTTDVEGEVNGLLTYDREVAKISAEDLKTLHAPLYKTLNLGETVLPIAARNDQPVRYTTTAPDRQWMMPGFDDSRWPRGAPGLGAKGTPGGTIKTPWTTPEVWYRTTFDHDAAQGTLMLNICYDEDPVVYINGVKATQLEGYTTSYVLTEMAPAALKTLKPTGNVLAVNCRNHRGGQYIDAGLVYMQEE